MRLEKQHVKSLFISINISVFNAFIIDIISSDVEAVGDFFISDEKGSYNLPWFYNKGSASIAC